MFDIKISPRNLMLILFITDVFQGFTSGALHLTHMIPDAWIPYATAWLNFIVFVNLTFLTIFAGFAGPGVGPLAKAPTMAEAKEIVAQAVSAKLPTSAEVQQIVAQVKDGGSS